MASTYTWANALTVVSPYIKSISTSAIDATVCDQLNAYIWKAGIWRWSLASLTSASGVLSLVDGVQDYGIGTTTGAGYYRLWRVRITRTDVSPWVARDKDIAYGLVPCLDLTGSIDSIQAIGYEPVSSGLRLERAASVPSGTTYQIDGEYQFAPVKITSTATTIVFPDHYFSLAIEGLKWKYYELGDDPRWQAQQTIFLQELEKMKADEDLGNGDMYRFPGDVMGSRGVGNAGLFGFY